MKSRAKCCVNCDAKCVVKGAPKCGVKCCAKYRRKCCARHSIGGNDTDGDNTKSMMLEEKRTGGQGKTLSYTYSDTSLPT